MRQRAKPALEPEASGPEPVEEETVEEATEEHESEQPEVALAEDAERERLEREARRYEEELRRASERERTLLQAIAGEKRGEARPSPAERHRQRLAEAGIPEEAVPTFQEMVEATASEVAARQVQALMEPFLRAAEAQQQIDTEFGEYPRADVARYLAENPTVRDRYNRMLMADPLGAAEYALMRLRQETAGAKETEMRAEKRRLDERREAERKHARLPSGGAQRPAQSSPQGENVDRDLEELAKLADEAQKTRNYAAFVRKRLQLAPSFAKINWAPWDEG